MTRYTFGVLDALQEPIDFGHGTLEPLMDSDSITALLHSQGYYETTNKRWWIYPPIHVEQRQDRTTETRVTRDNSRRPAHLWRLPESHCLELSDVGERRELADIIIQTLAFLDGTRLQFSDWLHEGRRIVRRERRSWYWSFGIFEHQIPQILWQVCQRYLELSDEQRQCLRCILHQYNRIEVYEWHWEQFSCAYSAIDACWAFFTTQSNSEWEGTGEVPVTKRATHRSRMKMMCDGLGIDTSRDADLEVFDEFCNVRNELTHEAIWAGGVPGEKSSSSHFQLTLTLGHFLSRLIFHALGIKCNYRDSPGWASHSTPAFGLVVCEDGPPANLPAARFQEAD